MSDRKLTYLFNPPQKDPRTLKAEFVVRTEIFISLFTDIQEDTMQKPPQHYMILGQRGMGKTTMLLRLKYAIEEDETLNNRLLPVMFNEEQYSMPDLSSFFEHIAKLLAEDHPVYSTLLDTMRVHEYEDEYEQKAYEILVEKLKENKQKIIVFHDNFGQFLDKIGKISTHRLRNILMNSSEIRLVGASATLLEHTSDYNKPFFDFFYQIRLKGMTAAETILLFEKLAENEGKTEAFKEILKTERPRIEVMRKLSGGVIRTMVMLFDVFIDSEKQDSFKDLEAILDRVTPLYKHRMDDLKPQQQLIVDAVAKAWDAVTVSEIAEIARADRQGLKTNQISAQLKQLVDNQIIEIEPRTTGRTNLYRLQERFFNIWYLMRYSTRQDKQRVVWLVKFLEGWCDTNDLKQLFDRFDNNLENGTYELSTVFDRALAYSMVDNDEVWLEKEMLLKKAINYLAKSNTDTDRLKLLLKQRAFNMANAVRKAYEKLQKEFDQQIELFDKLIEEFINENNAEKLFNFIDKKDGIQKNLYEKVVHLLNDNNTELSQRINDIFVLYRTGSESLKNIIIYLKLSLYHENGDVDLISTDKEEEQKIIMIMIVQLLGAKQYHTAYKFFAEIPRLKNQLKPIYFLTMEYLKDEYPNEYLKAGEEYRETIEELKERVKWFEENLG
jgi:hypothetical protein